jgi:hypothetical protein
MIIEKCNECGRNVHVGSGLFVNRIPDGNDIKTRIQMRKPFPEGDFVCSDCDRIIREDRYYQ